MSNDIELKPEVIVLARKMEAEDFTSMDCGGKPKHFKARMVKDPEATPSWYFTRAEEILSTRPPSEPNSVVIPVERQQYVAKMLSSHTLPGTDCYFLAGIVHTMMRSDVPVPTSPDTEEQQGVSEEVNHLTNQPESSSSLDTFFIRNLKECKAEVATWPQWKQEIMRAAIKASPAIPDTQDNMSTVADAGRIWREHTAKSEPGSDSGKVMGEVLRERDFQDKKWGGPEHDDSHDACDFASFIDERTSSIFGDAVDPRHKFIQIAALAVAAIEMLDREAALLQQQTEGEG